MNWGGMPPLNVNLAADHPIRACELRWQCEAIIREDILFAGAEQAQALSPASSHIKMATACSLIGNRRKAVAYIASIDAIAGNSWMRVGSRWRFGSSNGFMCLIRWSSLNTGWTMSPLEFDLIVTSISVVAGLTGHFSG